MCNEILTDFLREMYYIENLLGRDFKWITSCALFKWPIINLHVDFIDKSVLDVGCHAGYSCFESVRKGAKIAVGFDKDNKFFRIGEHLSKYYDVSRKIRFETLDLTVERPSVEYDIILCLGTLHTFEKELYLEILGWMNSISKKTIVLESRIDDSPVSSIKNENKNTIPTGGWLDENQREAGFKKLASHIWNDKNWGKRILWIGDKI